MSIRQPDGGTIQFRTYIEFAANGQLYLQFPQSDTCWSVDWFDHDEERAKLITDTDTGSRSRGISYRDIHGKATFVAPTSMQETIDEWSDQP